MIKSQKGASAIEFALILPVFLVLTFGIIEFSLLLYNKQVITNASREGARAGIVAQEPRRDEGVITGIVNNYCSNYLITFGSAPTSPSTVVTGYNPNAIFGQDLTVNVSYNYSFLVVPGFIPGIPSSINLSAQTLMKYE